MLHNERRLGAARCDAPQSTDPVRPMPEDVHGFLQAGNVGELVLHKLLSRVTARAVAETDPECTADGLTLKPLMERCMT